MTQLPTYCRWSGRHWTVTYDGQSIMGGGIRIHAEGARPSELANIANAIAAAQKLQKDIEELREQRRAEAATSPAEQNGDA